MTPSSRASSTSSLRRLPAITIAIAFMPALLAGAFAQGRQLSFEQRVAAQETIDRVYYTHQEGATRPFEEVVSRSALEGKVRTYLKQSLALEQVWATPVTAESLQAELERMVRETRSPERLRELFAALGNDAFLIQECLVRPALVVRSAHGFFSHDETIHGAVRAAAGEILAELESGTLLASDPHPNRSVVSFRRKSASTNLVTDGGDPSIPQVGAAQIGWINLNPDEFTRLRSTLPGSVGVPGSLSEDDAGVGFSAILTEEVNDLVVARWTTPKRNWDEWWATARESFDESAVPAVASTSISLPGPLASYSGSPSPWNTRATTASPGGPGAAAPCLPDDTWDNSGRFDDYLEPRYQHTAIWTGSLMIVWGGISYSGVSGTGSRYDPATDTWTTVSTINAPEPRNLHTAIWSGSKMIVWGGGNNSGGLFATGGRYDPATDTWSPTRLGLSARAGHSAVWTGSEMIVWGGFTAQGFGPEFGGRYDPVANTWRAMSTLNGPPARAYHAAVWTGSEMILWGGTISFPTPVNSGGRYDPATDRWTALPVSGAPLARFWHISFWTGRYMIVLGGYPGGSDAGGRFDTIQNIWLPMSTTGASYATRGHAAVWDGNQVIAWANGILAKYNPIGNYWIVSSAPNKPPQAQHHTAVWTGTQMIVWGGQDTDHTNLSFGGRYTPSSDSWTRTATLSTGPSGRFGHKVVWTGSQMVVWGGEKYSYSGIGDGGRYDPALDTWFPVATQGGPGIRSNHTATWTGHYMVVWGGGANTGGRYDPLLDAWLPTSTVNAPSGRANHTAIWTGTRMIIWGGQNGNFPQDTGALYDPETDVWFPTSPTGAPARRSFHSAVWTGSEMIVWGGDYLFSTTYNDGGLYNPQSNSWRRISTSVAPTARWGHTAIWTGTEMVVWGGVINTTPVTYFQTGGRYDPGTDTWRPTSLLGAPARGYLHTAIWTGLEMIVWGGGNSSLLGTGARYEPTDDSWIATQTLGAPYARWNHSAIWTGSYMVIWGGSPWGYFTNGGLYALGHSTDDDGDGVSECGGDCNDGNAAIYPGAPQSCDGVNTDCTSSYWPLTPPDEADNDRDGFRICEGDCNDASADIRPTATEICNGIDDDCDALTDEDPQGVDSDLDLVQDMCDNCRLAANPGQEDVVHPNGIGDACDDPDADIVADAIDNCADTPNTSQLDVDMDGPGDACDVCPAVYNPGQEEAVACISMGSSNGQCVPTAISKDQSAVSGKVTVSAYRLLTPTSIAFEIYVASCNQIDQMEFFLNGASLGTFSDAFQDCSCAPPVQTFVVSDALLLGSLWNPSGNNVLRITKTGYLFDYGSFLTWVRARIVTPESVTTECVYDPGATDCTNLNSCRAAYDDYVDHSITFTEPFLVDEGRVAVGFTDSQLPDHIDISSLPPAQARICVETREAGTLYGTSPFGELFRLDPGTGSASLQGSLSDYTEEIEYDDLGHSAFAVPGVYPVALREFNIQSGEPIGQPGQGVPVDYRQYTALEFVESRLYATTIDSPSTSILRILSPATGESRKVGVTGRGYISGLAWDENRHVMYAAEAGSTGQNLLTINLTTGAATVIAPLGFNVNGLEFGTDGFLYGGGNSLYLPTRILRIDTATGTANEITIPGHASINSLTLAAPIHRDCVEFVKGTQGTLVINRGCNGPPTAAAGPDFSAGCSYLPDAIVTLDGSGSSTSNSPPNTHSDIVLFEWFEHYRTPLQTLLGNTEVLQVTLPFGEHLITLRVTDRAGASDTDDIMVRVGEDLAGPEILATASPSRLWPPNHHMVEVGLAITAVDLCGPSSLSLVSVSSNEPDDAPGGGDGSTTGDIQVVQAGTEAASYLLRAERDGSGDGRVYSFVYQAVDVLGNMSQRTLPIVVPHDQGGITQPLDLDVREEAAGTVVEWNHVPGALFYNIIRGDLFNLRDNGSIVDLGAVHCIEAASLDFSTAGSEDAALPSPGRAFFYLAEYNDGWISSYGQESVSRPRVARSGACE